MYNHIDYWKIKGKNEDKENIYIIVKAKQDTITNKIHEISYWYSSKVKKNFGFEEIFIKEGNLKKI